MRVSVGDKVRVGDWERGIARRKSERGERWTDIGEKVKSQRDKLMVEIAGFRGLEKKKDGGSDRRGGTEGEKEGPLGATNSRTS